MFTYRLLFGLFLLGTLSACTSTGPRVLERSDDLGDTPEWTRIERGSFETDGEVYFLGHVEVDGEVSKSGALNLSDEKALSEPMRALVDQFLDQNQVGEDLRQDSTTGQRIISATRGYRPPMPGLRIAKRYWETVFVPGPRENTGRTVLRVYSLAGIPVADLEKAKQNYFLRLSQNTELKKILRDVGARQRDNILGPREPASSPEAGE